MLRKSLILTTAILGFQTASGQLFFDVTWLVLDAFYTWDNGQVEVKATEFGAQPAIMYGANGGWQSDNLSSGFGFYYSSHTFDLPLSLDYRSMDYFYSTFYVGYHYEINETIEISTPCHFGYGTIHLDGNAFGWVTDVTTNMFVVEPGVHFNWYPLSWLKVFGGGSYRLNMGSYTPILSNRQLSAPAATFGLGFGRFF